MYILEKLNFKISPGSMSRDPPGVLYRDIYFKDRSSCVRACTNPRNVTTFEATATTKTFILVISWIHGNLQNENYENRKVLVTWNNMIYEPTR